MSVGLFDKITMGSLTLENRINVAPMCQYSAVSGTMNDWHLVNLGQIAIGGPGLITIEATAVEAAGRITHGCTGLYSDENEKEMQRVIKFCKSVGHSKVAIQLGHAGRKASSQRPWEGGNALNKEDSWLTYSSSSNAFSEGWHTPVELDELGLKRIKDKFVEATLRSVRMGVDAVELHCAHGYLLHQFLSPICNERIDSYGGSLDNRIRYPLEILEAVKEVLPSEIPLIMRVSATDWVDGGWDLDQTTEFSKLLIESGCDSIHVSSGGISTKQKIPLGNAYQTSMAAHIRKETGAQVIAVGMITEPIQADSIIRTGQADMVALAREFLRDPRWTWKAAKALNASSSIPSQYQRAERFS
jgi:2,4-dienoyl-CoA reductase-like NADH-dependent reductase (Old Yellow Enzyme family)